MTMHAPASELPWVASDLCGKILFVDRGSVIDPACPVAAFAKEQDARFVLDAINLLAKVSRQIDALHRAFGAPGDYGYSTAPGDALYQLYQSGVSLRQALDELAGGAA